jgi:diacylglycerol kinase (ATP)
MPATHPLRSGARLLVLVNPASGGGRARRALPQVVDYLHEQQVRADFAESTSGEDLEKRAGEAGGVGYTHLAVLGGDGAFHHATNGAFGYPLVLGLFPAGSGNDIAAGLGIPNDPIAAAHAFLRSPPREVDAVRVRCANAKARLYVGAGGLGLDAETAQLVNGRFRRLPGVMRYIAAALWLVRKFEPLELVAEMDGERWSGTALFAVAANAPSYGSGVKIAPQARMDDGWLEITLVGALSWTRLAEALPPVLRTGDLRWPEIRRYRARRVRFETNRASLFHGDGEVLGESPVEIELLPNAIQVAGGKRSSAISLFSYSA